MVMEKINFRLKLEPRSQLDWIAYRWMLYLVTRNDIYEVSVSSSHEGDCEACVCVYVGDVYFMYPLHV